MKGNRKISAFLAVLLAAQMLVFSEAQAEPAVEPSMINYRFENNIADSTGVTSLIFNGIPSFSANDKREGDYSLNFNGSTDYLETSDEAVNMGNESFSITV